MLGNVTRAVLECGAHTSIVKLSVVSVLLFAGLTLWALVSAPWVVPAFALMTGSRICSVRLQRPGLDHEAVLRLIYARFAFLCVGLAWFAGCFFGKPSTMAFWAVFGTVCVIMAPVLTVMWKSMGPAGR